MAKSGDELTNPEGERLLFRQTAAETNGELLEMEVTYNPNSSPPPEHYHPFQEERFEILSGSFRASIGGRERTYEVGDKFVVPSGTPHWMYNASDKQGCLNWQTRPALDTESFFETLWGLARDGKTNENGVPNLLQVAVIGREFSNEFRLVSPPYTLQRILFAVLAPVGRLFGYQAKYTEYSSPN